jgi:hypothetical protein
MQLMYDIESYAKSYSSHGKKKRLRLTSTMRGTVDYTPFSSMDTSYSYYNVERTGQRKAEWKVTSGCILAGSPRDTLGVIETLGLNSLTESTYEMIPFSFMLDWFLDVGTRLQALETSLGRNVLGTWTTTEWNLHYAETFNIDPKSMIVDGESRTGIGGVSSVATERLLTINRVANPTVSALPQLNIKFNWKRLADALSILRVLRGRSN